MSIGQQRAAFEARFPMPANCQWCGNGYAPTEFNAWDAQAYGNKWKGFHAAIEFDRQGRGEPVAWRHNLTFCLYENREDVSLADGEEWAEPLYLSPQPAEPVKEVSDTGIHELLGQYGDHNVERGRIVFDKWTLAEAGSALLASYGKAVEPAASAEPKRVVTLSGAQLLQALDFIAPDRDADQAQLESEACIDYGDGHSGKGYYCHLSDYPEEGAILLDPELPADYSPSSVAAQPNVPEGHKLVPVEPTQEMMNAGLYQSSRDMKWADLYSVWKDMLAAAPTQPADGQAQQENPQ